jgi:hypothetical protein
VGFCISREAPLCPHCSQFDSLFLQDVNLLNCSIFNPWKTQSRLAKPSIFDFLYQPCTPESSIIGSAFNPALYFTMHLPTSLAGPRSHPTPHNSYICILTYTPFPSNCISTFHLSPLSPKIDTSMHPPRRESCKNPARYHVRSNNEHSHQASSTIHVQQQ